MGHTFFVCLNFLVKTDRFEYMAAGNQILLPVCRVPVGAPSVL